MFLIIRRSNRIGSAGVAPIVWGIRASRYSATEYEGHGKDDQENLVRCSGLLRMVGVGRHSETPRRRRCQTWPYAHGPVTTDSGSHRDRCGSIAVGMPPDATTRSAGCQKRAWAQSMLTGAPVRRPGDRHGSRRKGARAWARVSERRPDRVAVDVEGLGWVGDGDDDMASQATHH